MTMNGAYYYYGHVCTLLSRYATYRQEADKVAIEFAEWIGRNGYRKISDIHGATRWVKGNGLTEFSVEQLYSLKNNAE